MGDNGDDETGAINFRDVEIDGADVPEAAMYAPPPENPNATRL